MRVVIDARFFGTENGGLGRYAMKLLGEIKNINPSHEIIVIVPPKYKNDPLLSQFKVVSFSHRYYSLLEQLLLPIKIWNLKPDIVHFLHFNVPVLYFGKYILTIHDLLMHSSVGKNATTLPMWKYYIKRLAYRIVFDRGIYKSQKIICPSNFVKEEILKTYPHVDKEKISVLYEGVEIPEVKPHKVKRQDRFLYVGNVYPHKNIELLLSAFSDLIRTGLNIRLTIVTPKNLFLKRLQRSIRKLRIEKNVVVRSLVSDTKLSVLYRKSKAFVFPSLMEGFGLPGVEAMASGTLLVASDIPVFHEVYKEHAIYFDPNEKESLKRAILEVVNLSKSNESRRVRGALSFVKKYSWNEMAQKTLKLYEAK